MERRNDLIEVKAPSLHVTHHEEDGTHVVGIPDVDWYEVPEDMEIFFHGFYHGDQIDMHGPIVKAELWAVREEERDAEYYWKNLADPK